MPTTHHATIIAATSLEAAGEQLPVVIADVDTDVLSESSLSMSTVRNLIARAQQRPVRAPVRSFVVVANQIPVLAQNALLKLFEDPPAHAQFVVVMPRPSELIPTLRSRVLILDQEVSTDLAPTGVAKAFLAEPVATQLATVEQWVKASDLASIDELLTGIEHFLAAPDNTSRATSMQTFLFVSTKLRQPGASKKMLLEHLVLSLAAR